LEAAPDRQKEVVVGNQPNSRENRPLVEPSDPVNLLRFKELLEEVAKTRRPRHPHKPGPPILRATRIYFAWWRVLIRSWFNRISRTH
jgi:hypothetical protein